MKITKTQEIHSHLQSGKSISPLESWEKFGCYRLASVIHDMRQKGADIHTDMKATANGSKHAVYTLLQDCPANEQLE